MWRVLTKLLPVALPAAALGPWQDPNLPDLWAKMVVASEVCPGDVAAAAPTAAAQMGEILGPARVHENAWRVDNKREVAQEGDRTAEFCNDMAVEIAETASTGFYEASLGPIFLRELQAVRLACGGPRASRADDYKVRLQDRLGLGPEMYEEADTEAERINAHYWSRDERQLGLSCGREEPSVFRRVAALVKSRRSSPTRAARPEQSLGTGQQSPSVPTQSLPKQVEPHARVSRVAPRRVTGVPHVVGGAPTTSLGHGARSRWRSRTPRRVAGHRQASGAPSPPSARSTIVPTAPRASSAGPGRPPLSDGSVVVQDVPADGNCALHAISLQLPDVPSASTLRGDLATVIRNMNDTSASQFFGDKMGIHTAAEFRDTRITDILDQRNETSLYQREAICRHIDTYHLDYQTQRACKPEEDLPQWFEQNDFFNFIANYIELEISDRSFAFLDVWEVEIVANLLHRRIHVYELKEPGVRLYSGRELERGQLDCVAELNEHGDAEAARAKPIDLLFVGGHYMALRNPNDYPAVTSNPLVQGQQPPSPAVQPSRPRDSATTSQSTIRAQEIAEKVALDRRFKKQFLDMISGKLWIRHDPPRGAEQLWGVGRYYPQGDATRIFEVTERGVYVSGGQRKRTLKVLGEWFTFDNNGRWHRMKR
ncbi:unnamed protein product [Amoebophrya sp. A120]|nr:unnamed protein product [Amoebophrya sp. A120]|eukprot:GSA120T00025452001.1